MFINRLRKRKNLEIAPCSLFIWIIPGFHQPGFNSDEGEKKTLNSDYPEIIML